MIENDFDEFEFGYYQTLRFEARRLVVDALNRRIRSPADREKWRGITLSSITGEALEHARLEWPRYYGPDTHEGFAMSWEKLFYRFAQRPSHFNIAIWQTSDSGKNLQALALGKPSRAKTHLTLNWIERSFAPTYFRGGVLLPILASAMEYAKLLGSRRVLIKDPVDVEKYARYGFAYHPDPPRGATYLVKEL